MVRHRERSTWEIPGGHREPMEDLEKGAARELYEESGAEVFDLIPIAVYSVTDGDRKTYGQLFYSKVESMGQLPAFEIAEVRFVDALPDNLTYPAIQPVLAQRIDEFHKQIVQNDIA